MKTLKHVLTRYTGLIWAALKPLGSWGVFAIAGIDSALLGMPLDAIIAGYVYSNRSRFLLYVIMASAGSALGCLVLYAIGYKGGEVLLERRIPKARFEKIRSSFDRHEFWALMFPAMIPPPFPFKIFVLAAAVFEMNLWHFLLAIFAGRMVRFLVLSLLVLKFGPQAVALTSVLVGKHWLALLLTVAAVAGFWLFVRHRGRQRSTIE